MRKLQALVAFLCQQTGIRREQVHAFVDQGVNRPTGKDLGHGVEIGRFRYDAVLQCERVPVECSELLLSLIISWLSDNDPERESFELSDPDVDVTINDMRTCDVDITVEFDEGLQIVPDPTGSIPFNGMMWRVANVPVDVAEALDDFSGEAGRA